MKIQFTLPVFEGPLDLLLDLIGKHKMNIADIEISLLLEQYLLYLQEAKEQDMELAGEFLEMAARLIYIKTVALLPKPEEAEKAKKELEGALIEYAICQKTSEELRKLFSEDFFTHAPIKIPMDLTYRRRHDPEILRSVYLNIGVKKIPQQKENHARYIQERIQESTVPVYISAIRVLKKLWKYGEVELPEMYQKSDSRSMRVGIFLAVLELTRKGKILLSEDNTKLRFESEIIRKRRGKHLE